MGAGIEEFGDGEFGAALQAAVNHLPGGGGDEVGPDVVGEFGWFHGASGLRHRRDAGATSYGEERCAHRPYWKNHTHTVWGAERTQHLVGAAVPGRLMRLAGQGRPPHEGPPHQY